MKGPDRLIVVAEILGAFGVRGEVRVRSFTETPADCFSYGPLLDETGAVALTPLGARPMGDAFRVTAAEGLTREDWQARRGMRLHVRRNAMPLPEADEFYVEDLIGCDVVHEDGRLLGRVIAAQNFGAGDLLEVRAPSGEAFMLPFTRQSVPSVDLAEGRLTAAVSGDFLPEGLQRQAADGETN